MRKEIFHTQQNPPLICSKGSKCVVGEAHVVQNNLLVQFQIGNFTSKEETPKVQNSTGEMDRFFSC